MTLSELIEKAKKTPMTVVEQESQRISFAYGNAAFENATITRDTVHRESILLKAQNGTRERQSS